MNHRNTFILGGICLIGYIISLIQTYGFYPFLKSLT